MKSQAWVKSQLSLQIVVLIRTVQVISLNSNSWDLTNMGHNAKTLIFPAIYLIYYNTEVFDFINQVKMLKIQMTLILFFFYIVKDVSHVFFSCLCLQIYTFFK